MHVNHQLRGDESEADEQFVRELAKSLGLPFCAMSGPVGPGNLEQNAREIRRQLFNDAKTKFDLHRIALGHNRSDQAETVLFRLFRGSGLAGLAGISPVSNEWLIRPLLEISRSEIREYLLTHRIEFREDSSNQNRRFARNRLRLETIPALKEAFNPALEEVLAGTSDLAREEEDYWARKIERLYSKITKRTNLGLIIEVRQLNQKHLALRRRLIRRAFGEVRGSLRSIDRRHVDDVLGICESAYGHDRVNVPGLDAMRSFGRLLLADPNALKSPRDYRLELALGVSLKLPFNAGALHITEPRNWSQFCVNVDDGPCFRSEEAYLDHRKMISAVSTGDLAVRNWQPGDRLQQAGQGNTEKIKTLFQEHGVFLWDRRHWPVVVAGREIVWVRGFGAAEEFAVAKDHPNSVRIFFEASE